MKILCVLSGQTGLQYHRQMVPHGALYLKNPHTTQVRETFDINEMTFDDLKQFDSVHFLRFVDLKGGTKEIVERIKSAGCKIVFDIDDYWNLPPNHKMFKSNQREKVAEQTIDALRAADLVTTTTEHFAEKIREFTNVPVCVLPNCIHDIENQWQPQPTKSILTRFGWIGGVHHEQDVELLRDSIRMCHMKLRGFQMVLGGFHPNQFYFLVESILSTDLSTWKAHEKVYNEFQKLIRGIHSGKEPHNEKMKLHEAVATKYDKMDWSWNVFEDEKQSYKRVPGTDFYNYGRIYNECDVMLVPLKENQFSSYKSELKLIEAGMMGKACIVSRVKPYDRFPEDCVYFVDKNDNQKGWYKAIKKFLAEPELRKQYAANLQAYVKEHYNIDKVTEKRMEVYNNLIRKNINEL